MSQSQPISDGHVAATSGGEPSAEDILTAWCNHVEPLLAGRHDHVRMTPDEALGDHEDDVARIADMDGPVAAMSAKGDVVEVVLAEGTVRSAIEALTQAAARIQVLEGETSKELVELSDGANVTREVYEKQKAMYDALGVKPRRFGRISWSSATGETGT